MIEFKSKLKDKDKTLVYELLKEIPDPYGDAYITKNNLRLSLKENPELLFACLNKGDKIAFCEDGIAVVLGISDKAHRLYVRCLAKDLKTASKLLKIVNWNMKQPLWTKVKKNNPLRFVFIENRFKFIKARGKEILLSRKKDVIIKESRNVRQNHRKNSSIG